MEIAGGLFILFALSAIIIGIVAAALWIFGLAVAYNNVVILIGVIVLVVILAKDSYAIVPSASYGVKKFLEKRIKKRNEKGVLVGVVMDEGFYWKLPVFQSFDIFSYERKEVKVHETFFSGKDENGARLEIFIDAVVVIRTNRNEVATTTFEFSEEAIESGVRGAVSSEFGDIVGTKPAEVFIDNREVVRVLISSALQLADPLHWTKEAGERFDYCKANVIEMRSRLRAEGEMSDKRSEVEIAYGIDVLNVFIKDVDFTEKTKVVMESKAQDVKLAEAAQAKIKLMREFKAEGASANRAIDAAEVSLGQSSKQQIGVQGVSQGLINLSVGPQDAGKTSKKGKKQ